MPAPKGPSLVRARGHPVARARLALRRLLLRAPPERENAWLPGQEPGRPALHSRPERPGLSGPGPVAPGWLALTPLT